MEQTLLFRPLSPGKRSPASLAASIAVHLGVVLLLLLVPVAIVNHVVQPKQTLTYLAPKPLDQYKPKTVDLPKIKFKPLVLPPVTKVKLPEIRQIEPPRILPPAELPKVAVTVPNPVPVVKIEPTPVRPEVKTDVFATANANNTNLGPKASARDVKTDTFETQAAAGGPKAPNATVHTGGFGDPNGVAPSRNSTGRGIVMASFGSNDLPVGSGKGGGAGRQVVGSAGFGGGYASAGPGGSGTVKGAVKASGFGETVAAASSPKKEAAAPKETQVEILSKPKPVYSAEAKELKIEGQVALEVQFNAAGSIRVIRVLKGLGHGLDEAAENAAAQIRFRPATRDGSAIDSTNRVYIVFQLS